MALRSFRTRWADSWSDQKSGAEDLVSSWARRVRSLPPSKKAPHERDALAELCVAMFDVFEDHVVFVPGPTPAKIKLATATTKLSQGSQSPNCV